MQFSPFQVSDAGNGMIIGLNAIVHVLLSHGVAIGILFLIALGEWRLSSLPPSPIAEQWGGYQKRCLRFATFLITVFGAVTGAGIWFTISSLAPRAAASMLRIFFWAWFTEWLVFTSEVVVLLILYWQWDRLRARGRMRAAKAYVTLGFLSAVLITGNLGFMLTPGNWLATPTFWNGFLNPSFAPQLLFRLGIAVGLGALIGVLFALVAAPAGPVRQSAIQMSGWALLAASIFSAASGFVYFLVVPRYFMQRSLFAVTTSRFSSQPTWFITANVAAAAVILVMAWVCISGRMRAVRWLAIPAFILGAAFVVEFERVREFIRGPYLMPGYMYANGILLQETPLLQRGDPQVRPVSEEGKMEPPAVAGARAFATQCSICHTIEGLNAIKDRVAGRSKDGIRVILDHTHQMVSFMPPVSGTAQQRDQLAEFLWAVSQNRIEWVSRPRLEVKSVKPAP